MKIRVLGCSGSIAAGCRTTAFLLDDDVLLDAGTGVGDLTLSALARIDHVLLSHSHLDHIASVPLLADAVMRLRNGRGPILLHGLPATLAALRAHIFNGTIWPDFTALPTPESPILRLQPFEIGSVVDLGAGRQVEVLPAEHTVPAVGFAVLGPSGAWVFSGDTGRNPALWRRLHELPTDKLVIETAFRNEERALARISQHLCPKDLAHELSHLQARPEIYITHAKPGELDVVMAEIAALDLPHRVRALEAGQVFEL